MRSIGARNFFGRGKIQGRPQFGLGANLDEGSTVFALPLEADNFTTITCSRQINRSLLCILTITCYCTNHTKIAAVNKC